MSATAALREEQAVTDASRRTLTEDLRAVRGVQAHGVTFLDAKGRAKFLSYAEVWEAASRFAGGKKAMASSSRSRSRSCRARRPRCARAGALAVRFAPAASRAPASRSSCS